MGFFSRLFGTSSSPPPPPPPPPSPFAGPVDPTVEKAKKKKRKRANSPIASAMEGLRDLFTPSPSPVRQTRPLPPDTKPFNLPSTYVPFSGPWANVPISLISSNDPMSHEYHPFADSFYEVESNDGQTPEDSAAVRLATLRSRQRERLERLGEGGWGRDETTEKGSPKTPRKGLAGQGQSSPSPGRKAKNSLRTPGAVLSRDPDATEVTGTPCERCTLDRLRCFLSSNPAIRKCLTCTSGPCSFSRNPLRRSSPPQASSSRLTLQSPSLETPLARRLASSSTSRQPVSLNRRHFNGTLALTSAERTLVMSRLFELINTAARMDRRSEAHRLEGVKALDYAQLLGLDLNTLTQEWAE